MTNRKPMGRLKEPEIRDGLVSRSDISLDQEMFSVIRLTNANRFPRIFEEWPPS